jgi:glycosyltransferase involved in cell wall biosynthesis
MKVLRMQVLAQFSQGDVLGKRTAEATANITQSPGDVKQEVTPIPTYRNDPSKKRVLFCGTYPIGQSNGYSRVVYYIAKYLGKHTNDLQITIYGFQNYKQTAGSESRADIPKDIILHDALACENPRRNGFGEKEIASFLRKNPQDIVIIFNDMVITTALTQTIVKELTPEERKTFKLVSYMDQVYPYQKKQYIDVLNTYFDAVIAFTPYWKDVVTKQLGLRPDMPTYFFPHGFDHSLYYPIQKKYARIHHHLPLDAFVVLQLNRNQPRKRLDHTIMAWAMVVEKHLLAKKTQPQKIWRPMKLMIGTQIQGFWDLMEIYEHELKKRGISMEVGKEYIASVPKPQQLSDQDINILYNACDIGLNTCEGEGFGLCQFEHAAVGCPQVAPNIGGFKEFLHNKNSTLVDAKWSYYIDKQRDGIGGMAEVGDPKDYAEAIWKYYTNPTLLAKHGTTSRKEILTHYRWETMVDHFANLLLKKL